MGIRGGGSRGRIVKEGYPFVFPPILLSILFLVVGWHLPGLLSLVVGGWMAFFFRNPTRRPPVFPGAVLAPADGRVVEVTRLEGYPPLEGPVVKVSIFMSVFNVHVNRSPIKGRVRERRYEKGKFGPAYREGASQGNERNVLILEGWDGRRMACVQVAGVIARRIVCWVEEGRQLRVGEPFGIICFGSRVDCYLPADFQPYVRSGERVWAGESVLGYW